MTEQKCAKQPKKCKKNLVMSIIFTTFAAIFKNCVL